MMAGTGGAAPPQPCANGRRAEIGRIAPLIPERLTTERLVLRRPGPSDIEPFVSFYAGDRSAMALGPMERLQACAAFRLEMALWETRGFGNCALLRGELPVGLAGVWQPEDWDEPEIGWLLWAGQEGRGYAAEAARAVRDLPERAGSPPPVSYIDPVNHRSKAVARRLGARFERHHPRWPDTEIWRHRGDPPPGAPGGAGPPPVSGPA